MCSDIKSLACIGEKKAVKNMKELMEKENHAYLRVYAAASIAFMNEAHVDFSKYLENDEEPGVRGISAWALGETENPVHMDILTNKMQHDPNERVRAACALALGTIGNKCSIEPIMRSLQGDNSTAVRDSCAKAIAVIDDLSVVEPLIALLGCGTNIKFKWNAVNALGLIGDERAVKPLTNELAGKVSVKVAAIEALGLIGDSRATPYLVAILDKTGHNWDDETMHSLGMIGDDCAAEILEREMDSNACNKRNRFELALESLAIAGNRKSADVLMDYLKKYEHLFDIGRYMEAFANIDGPEIRKKLEDDKAKGNIGAELILYWKTGDKYNENDLYLVNHEDRFIFRYLNLCRIKWNGERKKIRELFLKIESLDDICIRIYFPGLIKVMPETFPRYDVRANYATRFRQARKIKKWFAVNYDRLAWDATKRRYYLKD